MSGIIPQLEYFPPLAGKMGQRFLELSLEIAKFFSKDDGTPEFLSEKFREWCELAKRLEKMWTHEPAA